MYFFWSAKSDNSVPKKSLLRQKQILIKIRRRAETICSDRLSLIDYLKCSRFCTRPQKGPELDRRRS